MVAMPTAARAVAVAAVLVCAARVAAGSSVAGAWSGARALAAPARFAVESAVLVNEAARRDREVGYRLLAALLVRPAWADTRTDDHFLLQFQLLNPQLHTRGKHVNADYLPHSSFWDQYTHTTFYAQWKQGLIETIYLDPDEPLDVLNYKRSLVSLFQFQPFEGERNETDISGTCEVVYEVISVEVTRKIKRRCWHEGGERGEGEAAEGVESRRLTRYSSGAALDELREVYAEEVHELGAGGAGGAAGAGGAVGAAGAAGAVGAAGAGVKARAWQRLRREGEAPAALAAPASLSAALAALPGGLRPHSLPLVFPPDVDDEDDEDEEDDEDAPADLDADRRLSLAAEAGAAALGVRVAGAGGTEDEARAALRLRRRLLAAPAPALLRLLHNTTDPDTLSGLIRAYGSAGGAALHAAADEFLQLRGDATEPLALQYLAALALCPAPAPSAVRGVLAAAAPAAAGSPRLAAAALLAAAAGAARLADSPRPPPDAEALSRTVKDALVKGLARCKEEECRAVRLRALGNLRRGDAAELLLEHATRTTRGAGVGDAALAAVEALGALPAAALPAARLARLADRALAPGPLDLRAAALDLVVRRNAETPISLLRVAYALRDRSPELRRVFWQRLQALAEGGAGEVRRLLRALPPSLAGWHVRALPGTSSVLERDVGRSGGWGARLESRQVARGGLLRRGAVTLLAAPTATPAATPTALPRHALTVEIWSRGLEAFASDPANGGRGEDEEDAGGEETEGEAAGSGLALTVHGARMPDITLFSGQAELLGLVWAGAGSEPTPALRALAALAPARARLPLAAGVPLHWRAAAALTYALDAQAQVSLWSRNAQALLELRVALAAEGGARVPTAAGELRVRAAAAAAPRLRLAAHLDFYDGVALCVRARTEHWRLARAARLTSALGRGARGVRRGRHVRRVRRERRWALPAPGRTLALGAPNDAACRALVAAEP